MEDTCYATDDEIFIKKPFKQRYQNVLQQMKPIRCSQRSNSEKNELPMGKAGLLSIVTFHWLTDFIWRTYRRGSVNIDLMYSCLEQDSADYNHRRIEKLWKQEVSRKGLHQASFGWVVFRFVRTHVLLGIVASVVSLSFAFLVPTVIFRSLLEYSRDPDDHRLWYGLVLIIALFCTDFVRTVSFVTGWLIGYQSGLRLRSAVMSLLYHKILRLKGHKDKSVGEIVNLFANDSQRLLEAFTVAHMILNAAVMSLAGTVYCVFYLGPWALLGCLIVISYLPYQIILSRLLGRLRRRVMKITDSRVRFMDEILTGIKLIKLYAWEKPFSDKIAGIRKKEKSILEKSAFTSTMSLAFAPMIPIFAAVATFIGHVLHGNSLSTTQAFVFIGVFNILKSSLNMQTFIMRLFSEVPHCLERFQSLLVMEEMNRKLASSKPSRDDIAIEINNATFAWDSPTQSSADEAISKTSKSNGKTSSSEGNGVPLIKTTCEMTPKSGGDDFLTPVLFGIELVVQKSKLVGVCGAVGSGKSSLISSMMGHTHCIHGSLALDGQVCYVPQLPWIQNNTLKENIIFGLPYDEKRYKEVLESCHLLPDVERLPGGDLTEIGELGINLSGGQKQRVSLARGLYSNRDIYILDDPLSAVDAHVGQHIFQQCLQGALADKTVVFITHQLQYLSRCDWIITLRDGVIAEQGHHGDLMQREESLYADLIRTYYSSNMEEVHTPTGEVEKGLSATDVSVVDDGDNDVSLPKGTEDVTEEKAEAKVEKGRLITAECLETGAVTGKTYMVYIKSAGGWFIAALTLVSFTLPVASAAFSNIWLSHWLNQGDGNLTSASDNVTERTSPGDIGDNPRLPFYCMVYGLTAIAVVVTSVLRGYLFMKATLRASSRLHDNVFYSVLCSPMSFFDCTPIGRTISRFSRDLDEVDVRLPMKCEQLLMNICLVFTSIIMVTSVFPWFLLALLPLVALFLLLNKVFSVVIREVKRVENMSRSPLLGHVATSLQGLTTIHAYNKDNQFLDKFKDYIDTSTMSLTLFYLSMRWLTFRLDLLTSFMTSITGLCVVLTKGEIPQSYAGLALVYASQMTGLLQYTVRLASETEANFTSVERIHKYIENVDSEAPTVVEYRPPPKWPDTGAITFKDFCLRYRPHLPLVLLNINCDITSREKIGLAGHTGAGKSSFGVALFRLVEAASGSIYIDGVDISKIGLRDLRSKLSIIPQDPALFVGTIRYNLDPFGEHSDSELWNALDQCHLKLVVEGVEGQLGGGVVENGGNFSVGERQLICMARALLRHSKILILDEATASIDTETDSKIQQTIREAFADCTLLTIAHRLNTVLTCDRIMVLHAGQIVEFDSPKSLLKDPQSKFYQMMQASEMDQDQKSS